jgi:CubicO group peptidase (beta-lactamase class C family)
MESSSGFEIRARRASVGLRAAHAMILVRTRGRFRRLGLIASAILAMLIMFDSCSALRPDRSAEKRMAAVEIGLDPPVVIAGELIEKWTIAMQMRRLHVPAVSVAVINDYKIDWARAWGVTEAGGNNPATRDTLFQAASISKPVASMAAMRLAQDGESTAMIDGPSKIAPG